MKLSPRLQTIADCIRSRTTMADIGTDHAYLPIYMVRSGLMRRAIASDINKGPIEIAQNRIRQYKLETQIEARLGSGLMVLSPQETDAIVIAGMGGMLIADIIEQSRAVAEAAQELILQPMLDAEKLRSYLINNGFEIYDEELAKEDRRVYEIICARYTGCPHHHEGILVIGRKIIEKKHPLAAELIERKIKEQQDIIDKLTNKESEAGQRRLMECQERIDYFNEVKKWLQ